MSTSGGVLHKKAAATHPALASNKLPAHHPASAATARPITKASIARKPTTSMTSRLKAGLAALPANHPLAALAALPANHPLAAQLYPRKKHHTKFKVDARDLKSLTKIAKLISLVSMVTHTHRKLKLRAHHRRTY
jgi:hypothetical protein